MRDGINLLFIRSGYTITKPFLRQNRIIHHDNDVVHYAYRRDRRKRARQSFRFSERCTRWFPWEYRESTRWFDSNLIVIGQLDRSALHNFHIMGYWHSVWTRSWNRIRLLRDLFANVNPRPYRNIAFNRCDVDRTWDRVN